MNAQHRLFCKLAISIFMLVSCLVAQATPNLDISPNGLLPTVANVPVVVTLSNPDNYNLRSFSVKLNGQDVTATFEQAAVTSTSGTSVSGRVEYLFGPGTYSVQVKANLASPNNNQFVDIEASSQFTVPGDQQDQRKNTILAKISEFEHQWDGSQFHSWINLGTPSTFASRAFQPAFQVYIDPSYLSDTNAVAAYVEKYIWKYIYTVYDQDLLLAVEPQDFSSAGNNNIETLWHEMIHAVSHGLQVSGASPRLTADDHLYIEWAESCIRGFSWLQSFEQYAAQNGIANPNADIQANARQRWKKFLQSCNSSTYGTLPTTAQKAEFQSVIGFNIDPNTVKQGYLGLGYSPQYFADLTVTITSPANGTETNDNQVHVAGAVTNNEPDLVIEKAGFSINGAIQLSLLTGNTFETTAVLKNGDNSIIAGVQTTDGQLFTSAPITVKSNALNNTYHARITWDKNDTDVDLHFSWSGGAECYYSNPTPTWGTAATSPRLDVDNTQGFGPENITIGGLPGPGTYRLWVYYYSDHGNGGTTVNATVYKDGVPIYSDSQYMTDHGSWTLVEFTVP